MENTTNLKDGVYDINCPGGGPERKGRFAHYPLCPSDKCGGSPQIRLKNGIVTETNCDFLPENSQEYVITDIPYQDQNKKILTMTDWERIKGWKSSNNNQNK